MLAFFKLVIDQQSDGIIGNVNELTDPVQLFQGEFLYIIDQPCHTVIIRAKVSC